MVVLDKEITELKQLQIFRALRDFENITMYRNGQTYGCSVNYLEILLKNIKQQQQEQLHQYLKQSGINYNKFKSWITSDDIIKIADISTSNQMNVDGMTQLSTGFYRVRVVSNTTFRSCRFRY